MLLVIFGAGASYDSTSDQSVLLRVRSGTSNSRQPPLAKDLVSTRYDALADDNPEARPIIALLRGPVGGEQATPLEQALAKIAVRAQQSIERRRQLIAFRFHLWNLIRTTVDQAWLGRELHGQTNYLALLNYLLDWQQDTGERVLLATFNYDMLLDLAAENVVTGWHFNNLGQFIDRPDFRLFKLHGSTNWARRIEESQHRGLDARTALIQLATQLDPSYGVIVPDAPMQQVGPNGELDFPAMAIPLAGKADFECPDEHVIALRQDLPRVTHVLIVGWRAAEPHALELLDRIPPGFALGIVTKGQDGHDELRGNLATVYDRARVRWVEDGGFSSFIVRQEELLSELLKPL